MASAIGAKRPEQFAIQGNEALQSGGGEGGLLNTQKDSKEAQTNAKFGDVWKNIQSRYGAKPEKPREIKKTLGKDDFLRIMITQMKHQDPTQPFKAEQYATQLAQFTSVEQLQNLNQKMGQMTTANQPLERLAMTNMIGKVVTIDRERFVHTENQASPFTYSLPADAKETRLSIIAADTGEAVLTKDLGPLKQGDQSFTWDGVKNNNQSAKSGNYFFRIEAKDGGGRSLALQNHGQAKVVGVSFEGQEAVLLVGDINKPQKIALRNIVRVDSNGGQFEPQAQQQISPQMQQQLMQNINQNSDSEAESPQASQQQAIKVVQDPSSNFFTFQKGVGSMPVDPNNLSPEAKRALAQYQLSQNEKIASRQNDSTENVEKPEEKGFPNGLNSGDNE